MSILGAAMTALQILCLVLVAAYGLEIIVIRAGAHRYFSSRRQAPVAPPSYPGVSLISPLRGSEAGTADNLRSFFRQDYPGEFEVLIAIEEESDSAASTAQKVLDEFPGHEGRIVYSGFQPGRAMGKNSNMIAGFRAGRHPILVFCDADVCLGPTFLKAAVAEIGRPEIGLAFPPPLFRGFQNAAAALYGLAYNPVSILVHGAMASRHRLKTALGAVMLIRRDVFEAIGGEALLEAQNVGIDILLARAVRHAGYRLFLLRDPVFMQLPRQSFKGLWLHFHRWFVTILHYYPRLAIFFLFFGFPLVWACLNLSISVHRGGSAIPAAALVGAVIGLEASTMASINVRWLGEKGWGRYLWVVLIFEPIFFTIFLSSLVFKKIRWGGRTWKIARLPTIPKEGP
jgi:ceramide glucosyltransferase